MTDVNFSEVSVHGSPEESPGFLLWRASTRWRRLLESTLKPFNLTHPQFVILATVGWMTRKGTKTTQAKIGRHAELDPNTTSQILRTLQAKGFVDRIPGDDERSKSPVLTQLGSNLLKRALPAVEGADAAFFSTVEMHKSTAIEALKSLAETTSK